VIGAPVDDRGAEPDGAGAASREWMALAAAWTFCLATLFAWAFGTPTYVLRAQLVRIQFWSLEACVLLGIVLGAIALRTLSHALTRVDAALMAAIAALALTLTLGVAHRTNRIFYDEQIYQAIGQNLAELRLAQVCSEGTIEGGRLRCAIGEYNKQPYAYPHLLSLVYRVAGVRPDAAFEVNAALAAITPCLVYLAVLVLFGDRTAAFFAALVFSLTPEQIVWSATAAVEPSAAWASTSALLATACFVRWRRTSLVAGAAVAAAYAAQFRPESFLLVPVLAALVWERAPEEYTRTRLWWAGLLFLALVAVHVAHTAAVRNEGWGTTQERLAFRYMLDNLRVNGWFYLADPRFPGAWTLFAMLGLTERGREPGRVTLALYFILFFGISLLFYAGSYDYGSDVRYSLATNPPLAMAAGLGLARIVRWLGRLRGAAPARSLVAAAACAAFAVHLPIVRATTDTAWASRADVAFAQAMLPDLDGDSYVLTHNPGMFHLWGVSAGQLSLAATDPAHLERLSTRYAGRLFLHWSFWCNVDDPVQRGFCTKTLALVPSELVRRHREGGQVFAFYRLRTTAVLPDPHHHSP